MSEATQALILTPDEAMILRSYLVDTASNTTDPAELEVLSKVALLLNPKVAYEGHTFVGHSMTRAEIAKEINSCLNREEQNDRLAPNDALLTPALCRAFAVADYDIHSENGSEDSREEAWAEYVCEFAQTNFGLDFYDDEADDNATRKSESSEDRGNDNYDTQ